MDDAITPYFEFHHDKIYIGDQSTHEDEGWRGYGYVAELRVWNRVLNQVGFYRFNIISETLKTGQFFYRKLLN
jgi:hypothetical protein